MRRALAVGDTVKCVVNRQAPVRPTSPTGSRPGTTSSRRSQSPNTTKKKRQSQEDDDAEKTPEMKPGRIIKIHEGTYDILFDEPIVQVTVRFQRYLQRNHPYLCFHRLLFVLNFLQWELDETPTKLLQPAKEGGLWNILHGIERNKYLITLSHTRP